MKKKSIFFVFILITAMLSTILLFQSSIFAAYDYSDVMKVSTAWFDANRCGEDASTNNVFSSWRGACHTGDSIDGGFHDAGDHVKFALPAAFSSSAIGWSIYEFRSTWESSGALPKAWQELRIFCDYAMDSWNGSTMVVQIGDGGSDHSYWGPPEEQTTDRPTYRNAGSDILGQTAGSLALMYINYKDVNSSYANTCLSTAKSMFNVGKNNMSVRSNVANGYYTSSSNYDDMVWAGIWLYLATGDNSYLTPLETWIEVKNDYGDNQYQKPWTYCWDDVTLANMTMLYKITGNQKYYDGIMWNFDWYFNTLSKTSYGLPYLDQWGVLRYNSAEAGLVYIMYKEFGVSDYNSDANLSIDYALGSNPSGTSFITNYGSNAIKHPHHRANEPNRDGVTHDMVGALAGGPNNDDSFTDDVNNYINNEVALDYNASFLLGVAGRKYIADGGTGGTPMPTPTPAETSELGDGDGLYGEYYSGTTFSGTPVLTRVDSTIDFNWGGGTPDSEIPSDGFSVKWTGEIEARSDEVYTFYISHDDGARVMIDGVWVIDNWTDHAAVEDSGLIQLEMGEKYEITVEFYENAGDASCQLYWSTPTAIEKEIIPQNQLYSGKTTSTSPVETETVIPTFTPETTQTTSTATDDVISYSVDYVILNDWGSGATVSVKINNEGSVAISGWTLSWMFLEDQEISNLWNGSYNQSESEVIVTSSDWNANIPVGDSISFGFNMTYSGVNTVPTDFNLN
ncbi:MAG: glycoside hydrolase family 9 protein [Clostridiales bacterium]